MTDTPRPSTSVNGEAVAQAQEHDPYSDSEIFRRLVDGVKEYAIFLLDPKGNIMTWNEGAQAIKGYTRDEIVGQHFSKFYLAKPSSSLASFVNHLKRVNQDSSAECKITDAVAFGDFFARGARVQAADIGIRLEPRNPEAHDMNSANESKRQGAFLKQLRGRTPLVNLRPYAEWMGTRTHRKLIASS